MRGGIRLNFFVKLNFYDKSFFLLYCFFKKKFAKKELPVLTSIIALGGKTFLQILLLVGLVTRIFILTSALVFLQG
jgi:hypothetical protein